MARLETLERTMQATVKYNTVTPAGQEIVLPTIRGTNFNVSDGVRNRVQIGNLPDYVDPSGVDSPAQYGARVLDGSGNAIFDTSGLTSVMKSLGSTDVGSTTFTSTTFAVVGGSGITFNLARQTNVLVLFLTTGFLSATGNIGFIRCNMGGATSGNLQFGPSNVITLMGWRFYPALAAGSHSIVLEGAVSAGATTLNTTESALQVFQLGA